MSDRASAPTPRRVGPEPELRGDLGASGASVCAPTSAEAPARSARVLSTSPGSTPSLSQEAFIALRIASAFSRADRLSGGGAFDSLRARAMGFRTVSFLFAGVARGSLLR